MGWVGQKKNECQVSLKVCHRYLLGGAYYDSCQKRLFKMKHGLESSIFKCHFWSVVGKQPTRGCLHEEFHPGKKLFPG